MLALTLTAELEGVTDLRPLDSQESPFWYTFKVQCTSCREIHVNWISLSKWESNEQAGSKGRANFVWKCKNCKREHSANIVQGPELYVHQAPAKAVKILQLDCRGLEFVEFKADGEWLATGIESGTKFESIDLSDGEWFDYDEKTGTEVSIRDLKWEIRRA